MLFVCYHFMAQKGFPITQTPPNKTEKMKFLQRLTAVCLRNRLIPPRYGAYYKPSSVLLLLLLLILYTSNGRTILAYSTTVTLPSTNYFSW